MKWWIIVVACAVLAPAGTGWAAPQQIATKSDISSDGSGERETTLGDLTADALRESAAVDVAFIPSSALSTVTLAAPSFTADQLSDALVATTAPANAYVTLHLKGKQILAALERSVSHLPESFDGFLQVSGIRVVYDLSRPDGSRIVSATLAGGAPLSPDSQYSAAMTQPLGQGGLGYFQAWNSADIDSTSDDSLATVLVKYAVAHAPLDQQTDGRLNSQ